MSGLHLPGALLGGRHVVLGPKPQSLQNLAGLGFRVWLCRALQGFLGSRVQGLRLNFIRLYAVSKRFIGFKASGLRLKIL